ncbi:hypothetical protein EIN_257100 [Entamoeba invadens IP1]|uniref:Uncharacterized protein n=1 Tax=Entamoeba invadens IP1 TaxID=370355 RepID=A0A0A1U741_ENTIV|nr:hypothetical protein EIN_257100 [Entamoeba invadens IP1]ELP90210.1 hypothetical protein EIN_257100 [Entamoeba invadens IP1]|eukprot:XP_004256981.1 hypothetical protein EIN_257100 [Entamoeba invadens IP1]
MDLQEKYPVEAMVYLWYNFDGLITGITKLPECMAIYGNELEIIENENDIELIREELMDLKGSNDEELFLDLYDYRSLVSKKHPLLLEALLLCCSLIFTSTLFESAFSRLKLYFRPRMGIDAVEKMMLLTHDKALKKSEIVVNDLVFENEAVDVL